MTKQHILDEIRRIAKANGGNSVGRLKFCTETGIKESDWRGVFWPRWNDAVREAGVTPNEKVVAYDEEWLILKIIALAREVGHFPTSSEFRIKCRNEKGFPTDTTISTRFGTKPQTVSRIADFCRSNEGYQDILAMCRTGLKSDVATQDDAQESEDEYGFVYLFKCGRFYKIGRSNAAGRRERELAIQMPEKATMVHQIRTDDPSGIENYWHQRFAASRKNGEWFDLSASDVKRFKRRKFM
jgi:hypothetical protein